MIDTVLFDLGNVLVKVEYERSAALLLEASENGTVDMIEALLSKSDLLDRYQKGTLDTQAFYEEFRETLQGHFTFESFRSLWNGVFRPNRAMIDLLPELSDRYRVGLVSNTNALHFDAIQEICPFFHYFDTLILSYEVGLLKPDRDIYQIALERIGSEPSSACFIDDTAENVIAAREFGLRAFHFRMPSHMIEEGTCVKGSARELLLGKCPF